MEKHIFRNNNGVPRLPPGFRFHPTDEELVVQYLKRKVQAHPLPAYIIPELDVTKSNPWDLPGDREQEKYFFSSKKIKYPNRNQSNQATKSGYWKTTGPDKQIVSSSRQNIGVIGMKRTLVFYSGKPIKGSKTDWVMHEYHLAHKESGVDYSPENWVLCRVFSKIRNNTSSRDDFKGRNNNLNGAENSSSSWDDASSGITATEDCHEVSSSADSFSTTFSNVFK